MGYLFVVVFFFPIEVSVCGCFLFLSFFNPFGLSLLSISCTNLWILAFLCPWIFRCVLVNRMPTCMLGPSRHVWLCATLWTVACQVLLSRGSPGKNSGVGCHALLQGIFLPQGLNPRFLLLLHWQASFIDQVLDQ